ncbi:MAG: ABC transporter ATP-binding protein [Lachnospiraceae bacterium]|nr:ABC transporter ATP-binding protein [Lachnospiraceae bacterium]
MIKCSNIHFHYNNKKSGFQIKDISLKIEPGYFTCLLGHNGAGKTTLLKLLYGMLMPESGDVCV